MADDIYLRLREYLDGLPGGFPETGTGLEVEILKRYFAPHEAEMMLSLSPYPETAGVIAERAQMEEAEAALLLESMARQGSIFRIRAPGAVLYMAMSFVVGIYEFHLKSMDRELAEMLDSYFPYLAKHWEGVDTKQLRVVPVGEALKDLPEVATYDLAREMVMKYDDIAVADCICRVEKGLLGKECDRPVETCLFFGFAAAYYEENEMGRKISREECLQILDRAEEAALVLCPSNSQDIVNICCCCSCCCGMMRAIKTYERPADHALSSFQARIDPGLCVSCGTCVERCQTEAVVEGEESTEVDLSRCIGCGLCVTTCPENAISMLPKTGVVAPPANVVEMNTRIMQERGLN